MSSDYKKLAAKLIKEARGKFSQEQVNMKLNIEFNQVAKWESQRKRISWTDFLFVCNLSKIDVLKAVNIAIGFGRETSSLAIYKFITSKDNSEARNRLSISDTVLKRRVASKEFFLDEILEIIDCYLPKRLQVFLTSLVEVKNLGSYYIDSVTKKTIGILATDHPEVLTIKNILTFYEKTQTPYKVGVISEKFGFDESVEKQLIDELVGLQLIEFNENDQIKLGKISFSGDINENSSKAISKYIHEKTHENFYLEDGRYIDREKEILGYNTMLVSDDNIKTALELTRQYYAELSKLQLNNTNPSADDDVSLYNLHIALFPMVEDLYRKSNNS
jgi:hypothetical protein